MAVRGDVSVADLPAFFKRAYATVIAAVESSGVEITGPPFGFYPEMPTEIIAVEAGFPISKPIEPAGGAHPFVLPGGRVVKAVHVGPYETMNETYVELQSWMEGKGIHPATRSWECYLSDPRTEPDQATWHTEIIWPVSDSVT